MKEVQYALCSAFVSCQGHTYRKSKLSSSWAEVYTCTYRHLHVFFPPPYILKIPSNINIISRTFRLITGFPNRSQLMLVMAVSMLSAVLQTDCTREISSAVTLAQVQWLQCGTQKEGRPSPDPSKDFDIYLTLTLKCKGSCNRNRDGLTITSLQCHQGILLHNPEVYSLQPPSLPFLLLTAI